MFGSEWLSPQVIYFWDTNTLNVALRDPKVKCTRGKLHIMAHDNLTTRDESVKRGGGSVTVWKFALHHQGPQVRYIGKSMCS